MLNALVICGSKQYLGQWKRGWKRFYVLAIQILEQNSGKPKTRLFCAWANLEATSHRLGPRSKHAAVVNSHGQTNAKSRLAYKLESWPTSEPASALGFF
eukprot:5574659-Pleurochrysis_carterae.AAC.1